MQLFVFSCADEPRRVQSWPRESSGRLLCEGATAQTARPQSFELLQALAHCLKEAACDLVRSLCCSVVMCVFVAWIVGGRQRLHVGGGAELRIHGFPWCCLLPNWVVAVRTGRPADRISMPRPVLWAAPVSGIESRASVVGGLGRVECQALARKMNMGRGVRNCRLLPWISAERPCRVPRRPRGCRRCIWKPCVNAAPPSVSRFGVRVDAGVASVADQHQSAGRRRDRQSPRPTTIATTFTLHYVHSHAGATALGGAASDARFPDRLLHPRGRRGTRRGSLRADHRIRPARCRSRAHLRSPSQSWHSTRPNPPPTAEHSLASHAQTRAAPPRRSGASRRWVHLPVLTATTQFGRRQHHDPHRVEAPAPPPTCSRCLPPTISPRRRRAPLMTTERRHYQHQVATLLQAISQGLEKLERN